MRQIAPLEIGECSVDILSSILYLSIRSLFKKIYFGIVGVVKQMWRLPGQGKRSEKVSIPFSVKCQGLSQARRRTISPGAFSI